MEDKIFTSTTSPMISAQAQKMYLYIMANAAVCNPIPSKLACQRAIYYIYHVEVDGYNAKADEEHWKENKPKQSE